MPRRLNASLRLARYAPGERKNTDMWFKRHSARCRYKHTAGHFNALATSPGAEKGSPRAVEVPVQRDRPVTREKWTLLRWSPASSESRRLELSDTGHFGSIGVIRVLDRATASAWAAALQTGQTMVFGFGNNIALQPSHGEASSKLQQQTRNLAVPNAPIRGWLGANDA